MKILLGSANEDKIRILKNALPADTAVIPIAVQSEVADQPLSLDETTLGSYNRAQNAIKAYGQNDFDYAVGMEGGITDVEGRYHLVCAVTVVSNGGWSHTAHSDFFKTPHPKEVSDRVKNGESFGKVIREYEKKDPNETVHELVCRKESFSQALQKAFEEFGITVEKKDA